MWRGCLPCLTIEKSRISFSFTHVQPVLLYWCRHHISCNLKQSYIYPLKSPSLPLRIWDPNKDTFMCVTTHAAVNELKCPLLTMLSLLNYENKKNLSITFSYYNSYQLIKAWKFCRNNCKFLSGLNDWVMVARHKFIL